MRRTALITGITGQDGSYLAEYLLKKGYTVHGIIRRSSSFNTGRIDHIFQKLHLHHGDMVDSSNLCAILQRVRPDEVYNLAAQSHVKVSFAEPEYTSQADGTGTLRLLEALRTCGMDKTARFYQASTSELFGKVQEVPQTETTPFYPRSPYAVAKLFAYWTVINYREAYKMFAVNGILFNHESPRRGGTFVTKKISTALARIVKGTQDFVALGNLNSRRDWGHARDYVRAMWLMLQTDEPDDFVIATNRQFSVRDFCELSFKMAGIELVWIGEGLDERGVDKATGAIRVQVSPVYFRPTEVDSLLGDSSKAKRELNWEPEVSFVELVHEMVASDFAEQGVEFCAKLQDFLPASS